MKHISIDMAAGIALILFGISMLFSTLVFWRNMDVQTLFIFSEAICYLGLFNILKS